MSAWRTVVRPVKFKECVILTCWICRSTFSSAFYAGAFEALSGQTVAFVFLTDILVFVAFSVLLFAMARFIKLRPRNRGASPDSPIAKEPLFDPPTTIALLFCGTAKGVALGAPWAEIFANWSSSLMRLPPA